MTTLVREVEEELGKEAGLVESSLEELGDFEDVAAGRRDTMVRIHAYLGELEGTPVPCSEIQELVWFDPATDNWDDLSAIIKNKVFPYLIESGLVKGPEHANHQ